MLSERTFGKLWNPDLVNAKSGKKLTFTEKFINRISKYLTRPIALIGMFMWQILAICSIAYIIYKIF